MPVVAAVPLLFSKKLFGWMMSAATYYQLTVVGVPAVQEAVSSFLFDQGAQGIWEHESQIIGYFPATIDEEQLLNETITYLHQLREVMSLDFDIDVALQELPQQDWNAEWKSRLKLLPVSDRILVKPTWVELPPDAPEIVIEMDPEMAFGSGEHATTRLTLQLIEKNLQPGMILLDVGVGTGILSIGALKLGARRVVAFDVDPIATETAARNAAKNGIRKDFYCFTGTLDALCRGHFDLIAANVNRGQIIRMLPYMKELLKPGGLCLLSGILDSEEELIVDACRTVKLDIISVSREKEWLAFETRKG